MAYPKRKDLFVKWSKAMVDGATVDKPNYSPQGKSQQRGAKRPRRHKRVTTTRKKREKRNG